MSDPSVSGSDPAASNSPHKSRWRPDRDLALALAAVVLSVCALVVSFVQTTVMRAQQQASVWPRLTADLSVNLSPDSLKLTVRNAGIGPAQLEWAQATLDSKPLASWTELISRSAPETAPNDTRASIIWNSLTGSVLVPGEERIALRATGQPAKWVYDAATRVGLTMCYCSVFDRCWQLNDRNLGASVPTERVTPVPRCSRPASPVL
ncbi:MAG TPA: hypothetical protein VN600_05655 [Gemmatimonadaceae bacterium]|nr:hypothetical protein [Gemmatimonadaceae bacterium]